MAFHRAGDTDAERLREEGQWPSQEDCPNEHLIANLRPARALIGPEALGQIQISLRPD